MPYFRKKRVIYYDILKISLLNRFKKTKDGFLDYFWCKLETCKTFSKFAVCFGSYLDRRIEMGKVSMICMTECYDISLYQSVITIKHGS